MFPHVSPARRVFGVVLISVLCLIAYSCTTENKTYITNSLPDFRPPSVAWVSVAGRTGVSPVVSGTVTLIVQATDASGIDSVSLYLNGFPRFSPHAIAGGEGGVLLDSKEEGRSTYAFPPMLAGGELKGGSSQFKLDFNPPLPPPSIEGGESSDSLFTFHWNTLSDSDGTYSLVARAWDKAGNAGETPALLIRVSNTTPPPPPDRTPPRISWIAPVGGSEVSSTIAVIVNASDSGGVDSVRLFKNGVTRADYLLAGHVDSLYTYMWDTRSDSDGTVILEAKAWDKAGNASETPALLIRVTNHRPPPEDRTPPDIWWESPIAGSTLSDTARLIARWFDESGVDSLQLLKDGSLVTTFIVSGLRGTSEHMWATTSDSDGVHLWEARGWDAARNVGLSPSLLVRVRNNLEPPPQDTHPPVIVWVAPQAGDTVQGRVDLHFQAMDDGGLDSAWVYVNGRLLQNLVLNGSFSDQDVIWITTECLDGSYVIDVRARDTSGNLASAVGLTVRVWNNRPRVIWVPDDYGTIQGAINASANGDTVRVRAGTYPGQTQFFTKNVSLISEEGPEVTILDGTGYNASIWLRGGQDTSMIIRGFTMIGGGNERYCILLIGSASPRIVNNILIGGEGDGIVSDPTYALIMNNLFINSRHSVQLAHDWGNFQNNLVVHTSSSAFWNSASYGQPLIPDYNLFWDYVTLRNQLPMEWGEHNITDREPLFEQNSYRLRLGSPGIDQGDPSIQDIDGTRSDIGPFGGPYAYR